MLTLDGLEPPREKGALRRAVSFVRPYLIGAAGSAYLFSVGWTRWRNRAAIVDLGHHFGYRHESRERSELPTIGIDELVPESSEIDLRAIDAVDGNVSERELITLCRLVRALQPKRLFELGTFDGRTTLNLAANVPQNAVVFTLDLPRSSVATSVARIHRHEVRYADKAESGSRFRGTDAERKIVQLEGDSGKFDFTPYYGTMDFVFIDASHTFDYVVNDSLHALGMMRPSGGTIVWHDYGRWDGVTAALNQLRRKDAKLGSIAQIQGTTLAIVSLRSRSLSPLAV